MQQFVDDLQKVMRRVFYSLLSNCWKILRVAKKRYFSLLFPHFTWLSTACINPKKAWSRHKVLACLEQYFTFLRKPKWPAKLQWKSNQQRVKTCLSFLKGRRVKCSFHRSLNPVHRCVTWRKKEFSSIWREQSVAEVLHVIPVTHFKMTTEKPSNQSYDSSRSPVWMWVGSKRRLSIEELMLLNCGAGEDSWESLGQQGDQISQS